MFNAILFIHDSSVDPWSCRRDSLLACPLTGQRQVGIHPKASIVRLVSCIVEYRCCLNCLCYKNRNNIRCILDHDVYLCKYFYYLSERKNNRDQEIFHSLDHSPARTRSGPEQNQEIGTPSYVFSRGQSTWTIFSCLPRCICRKPEWKKCN